MNLKTVFVLALIAVVAVVCLIQVKNYFNDSMTEYMDKLENHSTN